MKPKEHWGNPETKNIWLTRLAHRRDTLADERNTDITSVAHFIKELQGRDFNSVLEVGAGNGRLIGALSVFTDMDCNSVDINAELSEYVSGKYPQVKTKVGDVSKLPYEDNSFDLVYTYQVLQHVPPEEMDSALKELQRVAKKEVWLFEGYDDPKNYNNGQMRKETDGGSFAWYFDQMLYCYEVSIPSSEAMQDMGVKLYKIKK